VELNRKNIKSILFILCGTILFTMSLLHLPEIFAGLRWIIAICSPVIIGLCLAFLLTPLCEWYERVLPKLWGKTRGFSGRQVRSFSVILALLSLAGLITIFVVGLIPQLRDAYFALKESFPKLMQDTLAFIDRGLRLFDLELPDYSRIDWPKVLQSVTDFFHIVSWDQLLSDVLSTAVNVIMTIVDIAIGLFIALRVVFSRERIGRFVRRFIKAYCPPQYTQRVFDFASLANRSFRSFLVGQLKEAFCLGTLCCIGMTILGLPYAVAASVIVGASALIPIVGSWIGGIAGVNVFIVLLIGIASGLIITLVTELADSMMLLANLGSGAAGMFETIMVTLLVTAMCGLIRVYGGFDTILYLIRKVFKGRIGGRLGVGLLVGAMDIATANNTVAIVMAGPIARDISKEYWITSKESASLLDTFSCIFQGVIPYGAQMLVAVSAAASLGVKVSAFDIIPFLFYPMLLAVCSLVYIVVGSVRGKK